LLAAHAEKTPAWLIPVGRGVAVAGMVGAPLWVLLLCPLLFGIPHVLGDLWVLFLRPSASRSLLLALSGPLLGMIGLRVATALGAPSQPFWETFCGILALLAGAAWARAPLRGLGVLALALPALYWPSKAALYFGHAHNAVAVAILLLVAPRRISVPVAVVFGVGTVLILGGALDWVNLSPAAGLGMSGLANTLAPGTTELWGTRLVLSFGFAQAVHYLCWVLLLPLSTRTAGRLPWILVVIGAAGTLILCGAAWGNPTGVRAGYLSLVLFHGWMELGVLAAGGIRAGTPE
jgi:hypothetical protein